MSIRRHGVREQIDTAVERATATIGDTRVNRVLNHLNDRNLATAAAEQMESSGPVTIESVDLPHVWEDDRIVARVAELGQQGITVESKLVEKEAGGMTFKRWAICVRY